MHKDIENIIRRLSIKQLEALSGFIPDGNLKKDYINAENISNSIHTADDENKLKAIGGIISSLARVKTKEGDFLILPAGKDDNGMRFVLNTKVISREDLKEILLQIPDLNL